MESSKQRFEFLDALRGLAAIVVMLFHFQTFDRTNTLAALLSGEAAGEGWRLIGGGWIAVDLFFVLSGFVIAHSYGGRIIEGMSARAFASARLTRLAPVYLLGLLLGLIAAVLMLHVRPGAFLNGFHVFSAAVFGMLVLPFFNRYSWPVGLTSAEQPLFPLNTPSWSMFFELFANLCFFLYVHKFRRLPGRGWLAGVIALALVSVWVYPSVNVGWRAGNFLYGFPRVLAGFFLGVFLYQVHGRVRAFPLVVPLGLLAALFWVASYEHPLVQLCGSLILAPAIILTGSKVQAAGPLGALYRELGEISYPLYLLHLPIYQLVYFLIDMQNVDRVLGPALIGVLVLLVSALAGRADKRLRAWLTQRRQAGDAAKSSAPA